MKAWHFILMILLLTMQLIAQPHPVYIEIRNSADEIPEEGDIHFEAWLLENPTEILTEDTTDCYYPAFTSFVKINCGQFEIFTAGDRLHLEVWQLSTNEWGCGEFELNYDASQFFEMDEGGITLMEEIPAAQLDLPENLTAVEDEILTIDFSPYITNTWFLLIAEESENFDFEINGALVSILPKANWNGFEILTFAVRSWGGIEDSSEVLFWAEPVNDSPVICDYEPEETEIELDQVQEVLFVINAHDVDDELYYLWYLNGVEVVQNRASYVYLFNGNGLYEVTVIVSDGLNDQEITWSVDVFLEENEQTEIIEEPIKLGGNYPNPFNPETSIQYNLGAGIDDPCIEIYDLRGRKVDCHQLDMEGTNFIWKAEDKASGIYFYRIRSKQMTTQPQKMLFLK